jgi:HD superfamily phosphodiesterase
MKGQTAVEWLLENLNSEPYSEEDFEHNKRCWEQAKEMEKEQIIEAYNTSFILRDKPYSTAEKYYNETYESKNKN